MQHTAYPALRLIETIYILIAHSVIIRIIYQIYSTASKLRSWAHPSQHLVLLRFDFSFWPTNYPAWPYAKSGLCSVWALTLIYADVIIDDYNAILRFPYSSDTLLNPRWPKVRVPKIDSLTGTIRQSSTKWDSKLYRSIRSQLFLLSIAFHFLFVVRVVELCHVHVISAVFVSSQQTWLTYFTGLPIHSHELKRLMKDGLGGMKSQKF